MNYMAPDPSLVREEDGEFRVSATVYHDDRIFVEEMQRIFYRTWIYLGHESEVADVGDFKSTRIGDRAVFIIRDKSGTINGFFNQCTHRGAALCRQEYGNKKLLTCPYHAWSFRPSGELAGVPDRHRYPANFTTADKGLAKVPRLESYGGLLFGSLNAEIEPLEAFLGGIREYIDFWNARACDGQFKVGPAQKYAYPGNWKMQSENVVDGYHPHIVHQAAFRALKKFATAAEKRAQERIEAGIDRVAPGEHTGAFSADKSLEGGLTRGFQGGHSTLEAGMIFETPFVNKETSKAYIERVIQLHGEEKAPSILLNRHLMIFPNLCLFDHTIRVWYPISVNRTEIFSHALRNDRIDPALDCGRLLDVQNNYSSTGAVAPDDADIFAAIQASARSNEKAHFSLARGMGMETSTSSGELIGEYSDEVPQRSFWRKWQSMMSAADEQD